MVVDGAPPIPIITSRVMKRRNPKPSRLSSATMVGVSSWDELRVILRELEKVEGRPVWMLPSPRAEKMAPPFRIMLKPWAVDIAEQLDARFGNDVLLTVGFLPYPSARPLDPLGADRSPPPASEEPLLDESEVEVGGVQPFVVRSGYDLHSELLVTNRGTAPVVIENPGAQLGRVLDPAAGEVVGDSAGPHAWAGIAPGVHAVPAHLRPLVRFTASPGGAVAIPLLVGTASYRRSLGYAVPPDEWAVEVVLDLGTEGRRRAPLLPLHVTS